MTGQFMNNGLEIICKEKGIFGLTYCPGTCLEGQRKITKTSGYRVLGSRFEP
jgi:hypothetical protein